MKNIPKRLTMTLVVISLIASCSNRTTIRFSTPSDSEINSTPSLPTNQETSSSAKKEIILNVSSLSMNVGETKRVNIVSLPETSEMPVWEIDSSLADIALSFHNFVGEITAKKSGTTTLTVSLKGLDVSTSIPVTIEGNFNQSSWPVISSEAKDYYSSIDFTQSPSSLLISLGTYNRKMKKSSLYGAANKILSYAEEDPNNKGNVLLFYSGESRKYDPTNASATSVNKEHVWPRSRGIKEDNQADGDPHNLHLADAKENQSRGNKVYGESTNTRTFYVDNPIYQDQASRSAMYMQLTYFRSGLVLDDDPGFISNASKNMGMISSLLKWEVTNPVTSFEMRRNNRIQENIQNRNPFVDIPGLSLYLYGGINEKTKEIYRIHASDFGLDPTMY